MLRTIAVCFVAFGPLGWAADLPGNQSGSNPLPDTKTAQYEKSLTRARVAFLKGSYEEADKIYQQVIKQQQAAGAQSVLLARSTYELGATRKMEGRCDEAATLIQHGLAMLAVSPDPAPSEMANVWEALGAARSCDYAYTQAEHAYQKALEIERRSPKPRKRTIFEIQASLATVYQDEGKFKEALATYEAAQALEGDPEVDPLLRALMAGTYGPLLRSQGREAEAADAIEKGLAIVRSTPDPDGMTTAILLNAEALIQVDRKAYPEAAQSLSEALDRSSRGTASLRPGDRAQLLQNYAYCLRKLGDKKQARAIESQAGQLTAGLRTNVSQDSLVDVSQLASKH
jgi:tetratricopeptide (TPR) repeat protein